MNVDDDDVDKKSQNIRNWGMIDTNKNAIRWRFEDFLTSLVLLLLLFIIGTNTKSQCCCYIGNRERHRAAWLSPIQNGTFSLEKTIYFQNHMSTGPAIIFSRQFLCQQTAKFLDGKSWTDFKIRIPSVLPLAGAAAAATTTQPTMLIARVRHCQRRFAPPFSVVLVLKVPAISKRWKPQGAAAAAQPADDISRGGVVTAIVSASEAI